MKTSDLPFPRLELRWRKATKAEIKKSSVGHVTWACDYMMVIHKAHAGDGRCNKGDRYAARNVEVKLGSTLSSTPHPAEHGVIETPFRDGAHIQWDATALNLPPYVTCERKAQSVNIRS